MTGYGIVHDLGWGHVDVVGVNLPYAWKDRIKQLPGARWNPQLRIWTVPKWMARNAQQLVDEYHREQGAQGPTRDQRQANDDWSGRRRDTTSPEQKACHAFLTALPATVRPQVLAALRKALHPDTGGDTKWMAGLNAATAQIKSAA